MAWYDSDPQKAQQVLASLEKAAGRPLTPQEIEQAKGALSGDKLDPNALQGVQNYITQNIAGQPAPTTQPGPTTGPGPSSDPAATAGNKLAVANKVAGANEPTLTTFVDKLAPFPTQTTGTAGGFQYQPMAPFQGPGQIGRFNYDPYTHQFQAPDGLTESNDPGYQARFKMGNDAIQRSAAARGSLLTGGTLKALGQYGQEFASNEYGNVYNRALTGYQQDAANYDRNRSGAFQAWAANAGLSQQEQDQAWAEYQNQQQVPFNQQLQAGQLGLGYSQLNEQGRQADNSLGFNYANLGENSRQYGGNLGFNYWNAGNNQQLSLAQLGQQNNQFNANLGYQYAGLGQQGSQFGQQMAYNYAGLNSNNNQFYSGLNAGNNFNYAQLNAGINSSGAANYNDSIYGGANARAGGQVANGTNWANLLTGTANQYLSPYLTGGQAGRSLYGG